MPNHFLDLLENLRDRVSRTSALVQQSVEMATQALLEVDGKIAQDVITLDRKIDEEEVRVEKAAIDLLALHQPAASDLRLITTIIKVNSDYERIADCAVNIAQRIVPLSRLGRYEPPADLRVMAATVCATLRETIRCFNLVDDELARQVLRSDDVVDALYHQIVQDMLGMMETDGHRANADLSNIMIAKNLERIGDHCTNIAEDVVYVHTGRIIRHLHSVA